MNYYTILYLSIFLFLIYKNSIFQTIINFNEKKDFSFRNINYKKTLIIIVFFYYYYSLKIKYKILILFLFLLICYYYQKINSILNQFLNIYNNTFLINKFIFF